jgi:predicted  nucleic acid-binding Zn-ribbon protein
MSIALSEIRAGIESSGSHRLSLIGSETTPLYVVCSPRRSVGKTLLSRLLIEFHDLDDRPVTAFDLGDEGPRLADFLPDRAAAADLDDIYDQMAFFDSLISDDNTIKIIDLGHQAFRNFFVIAQKTGFFAEVRRHAIEPVIVFMADSNPKSAKAYSILQRWFPDVLLLPVRNRAVIEDDLDRDAFPYTGAVPVSLEIPTLHRSLRALVEQQSFSFAHFCRGALERFPARSENELRTWMRRVFEQFRRIETSLACGEPATGEMEERMRHELAEADSRIAELQDELAQVKERDERLSAEAAAKVEHVAFLENELMHARQIAREASVEADARIEEIKRETDERTACTAADTEERLARARAEIEGTFARLEAEASAARQRADRAEADAAAKVELIAREADERVKNVDRNTHSLIDQVFRLETELVNATQRADRAEQWLSRIRHQIEADFIPSFTAVVEGGTERSFRES